MWGIVTWQCLTYRPIILVAAVRHLRRLLRPIILVAAVRHLLRLIILVEALLEKKEEMLVLAMHQVTTHQEVAVVAPVVVVVPVPMAMELAGLLVLLGLAEAAVPAEPTVAAERLTGAAAKQTRTLPTEARFMILFGGKVLSNT